MYSHDWTDADKQLLAGLKIKPDRLPDLRPRSPDPYSLEYYRAEAERMRAQRDILYALVMMLVGLAVVLWAGH